MSGNIVESIDQHLAKLKEITACANEISKIIEPRPFQKIESGQFDTFGLPFKMGDYFFHDAAYKHMGTLGYWAAGVVDPKFARQVENHVKRDMQNQDEQKPTAWKRFTLNLSREALNWKFERIAKDPKKHEVISKLAQFADKELRDVPGSSYANENSVIAALTRNGLSASGAVVPEPEPSKVQGYVSAFLANARKLAYN